MDRRMAVQLFGLARRNRSVWKGRRAGEQHPDRRPHWQGVEAARSRGRLHLCLLLIRAAFTALCIAGDVQAQTTPPTKKPQAPRPALSGEAALRQQINQWTVGLAGGLLEGAPIRLATEMARVVNDGPNLHVLPIVTR